MSFRISFATQVYLSSGLGLSRTRYNSECKPSKRTASEQAQHSTAYKQKGHTLGALVV